MSLGIFFCFGREDMTFFISRDKGTRLFPLFTQENYFSCNLFGELGVGGKSDLAEIEQALSKFTSLSPRRNLSQGSQLSFSRVLWIVS